MILLCSQGLNLDMNIAHSEESEQYVLEEETANALSAIEHELTTADMSAGSKTHAIITNVCAALSRQVRDEFALLDDMHKQLSTFRVSNYTYYKYYSRPTTHAMPCLHK